MITSKMLYPAYREVYITKSTSSYGKYVVKTTDVTFKFFWKKQQAIKFVEKYNKASKEEQEILAY